MGGYITVMIRFSDGEILSKETWTNRISCYMQSVDFLNENKDYIKEKSFHKDDSDYRCPSEYGFVFFDFMKKKIISIQDYSDPSEFNLSVALMSMDREDSLNNAIKSGFVSKAHYRNHKDPDKNYTELLGDIQNISEFFLNKYPTLSKLAKLLNMDTKTIHLRQVSDLNWEYIRYCMKNPINDEILKWCKTNNIDISEKDFTDESKKNEIENIKKRYFSDNILSKMRLIEDWSVPIDKFEYYSKFPSITEFKKLKDYLDKEGIVFSEEDNQNWEKCFQPPE